MAMLLAACAVVLSFTALGVAIFALGRAGAPALPAAARDGGATTAPAGLPATGSTAEPADAPAGPATGPAAGPAGSSGPGQNPGEEVLPAGSYTIAYEKKGLTLQVECSRSMPIDLDEPRLGSEHEELSYTVNCGPAGTPQFRIGSGTSVSRAPATASNAADCAEAIRSSLLGAETVAVTAELALCVRTARPDAVSQGISQKIALVQVRAVNSNHIADVLVTAWHIPG